MKGIRKIAGKVTALAVAITTSVALFSPYDGNAQSGIGTTLTGPGCGFVQKPFTCISSTTIKYNNQGSGTSQWATSFGAGYQHPALNFNAQYNTSNSYIFENAAEVKVDGTFAMKCDNVGFGIEECTSEACIGQMQPVEQKCPGANCK